MNGKITLTAEQEAQILASIRSGGYAHVSAAAWGVPEKLWEKWQKWGAGKRARQPYRDLFLKVEQARGQARLKAEMAALEADPRSWLKHGPGKEQPGNPGWSALAKPAPARGNTGAPFSLPAFLQFLSEVRAALVPFPDAHAAVVQLMEKSTDLLAAAFGQNADSDLTWTDTDWRSQPTFRIDSPPGTMQEPDDEEEYDS